MGCATSISSGNKTESNVTNSTVNSQEFNMENMVSIVNTMNQESTLLNTIENEINQTTSNAAEIMLEGVTINITGKGNKLKLTATSSNAQVAKTISEAIGVVDHSADLTDSVMFDIVNQGSSEQTSDMTSAATSSATTELEASGIGVMATSIGVNNSVCTNVNNSISNLFSMTVKNHMSSATNRTSLAASINDARQVVKQASDNKSRLGIKSSTINLGGENNEMEASASASSETTVDIQTHIDSNLTQSLTAITDNAVAASTEVMASQSAKSSASASASSKNSTKVSTTGAIIAIAIVCVAGAAVMGILKAKKKGKNNQPDNDPSQQNQQQNQQQYNQQRNQQQYGQYGQQQRGQYGQQYQGYNQQQYGQQYNQQYVQQQYRR